MTPEATQSLTHLIQMALDEDWGSGDASSNIIHLPAGQWVLRAREPGVFCGEAVAEEVFRQAALSVQITHCVHDGESFQAGEVLQEYSGTSLLSAERILLNMVQHLTAISSMTAKWMKLLTGTSCQLMDTRKTTPGYRHLEKYAVLCGGGSNHRFGLHDAIMLKDNHHAAAGSPTGEALTQWVADVVNKTSVPVHVEVETVENCEAVIKAQPALILLDNMSLDEMKACVAFNDRPPLEATGRVSEDRLQDIAATGVERISCGALTQNPSRIDLGIDAV